MLGDEGRLGAARRQHLGHRGVRPAAHVEHLRLVRRVAHQRVAEAVGTRREADRLDDARAPRGGSAVRPRPPGRRSRPTRSPASKVGPTVAAIWTTRRSMPGALRRQVSSSCSRRGIGSVRCSMLERVSSSMKRGIPSACSMIAARSLVGAGPAGREVVDQPLRGRAVEPPERRARRPCPARRSASRRGRWPP